MYLCVDVGGTKTLVAVITDDGQIKQQVRFPTPVKYTDFVTELTETVATFTTKNFVAAGVGIPVTQFDRNRGIGISFGNLPWKNVPILSDIEKMLHCPVVLDNDAKMASLSEAMLVRDKYQRVLYVTVSTGIGYGLTVNGVIDDNIGDSGGTGIMLEHRGKLVPWESFASGHAIVERYGKRASDITDEATWKKIAHDLTQGFIELIAITEPDVVIVGGGVGTYFDRYERFLIKELEQYQSPLVTFPDFQTARRPDEAVIFGCYDLAKATYGRAAH